MSINFNIFDNNFYCQSHTTNPNPYTQTANPQQGEPQHYAKF